MTETTWTMSIPVAIMDDTLPAQELVDEIAAAMNTVKFTLGDDLAALNECLVSAMSAIVSGELDGRVEARRGADILSRAIKGILDKLYRQHPECFPRGMAPVVRVYRDRENPAQVALEINIEEADWMKNRCLPPSL